MVLKICKISIPKKHTYFWASSKEMVEAVWIRTILLQAEEKLGAIYASFVTHPVTHKQKGLTAEAISP